MDGFQGFPAPAKLNLHLRITGRRADGYHLLDSVFVLLDVGDTVRLHVRSDGRIQRASGPIEIAEDDDLTVRAARALQRRTGCKLGVDIALEKVIPIGGGLGGGSSDAATTLLALNKLWATHLTRSDLMRLGLELGADVPFFIFGENAHATGVGEQLRPRAVPQAWYVVLAPPVAIATHEVFAHFDLTQVTPNEKISGSARSVSDSQSGSGGASPGVMRNDLEAVVCARYPEVMRHLSWLKRFGDARMTGSGSCVFLLCPDQQRAQAIFTQRPADMLGFVAKGLQQHPLRDFC